jgi:hypothetical protein
VTFGFSNIARTIGFLSASAPLSLIMTPEEIHDDS